MTLNNKLTVQKNTSQNKNILHLIDTTGPGGAERVFVQLADKLRGFGYNSVVVIRGQGWLNDELNRHQLNPIIIPAKGSFAFRFLIQLIYLIRKHKIKLIQSHLLGSNVYAALAGLITATPVIATYHGMVDIDPKERFQRLKRFVMRQGISHYVTVSKSLQQFIQQTALIDVNKTSVIYNGVDLQSLNSISKIHLRKQLNLSDDCVLIGSLGNVRPAKGYHILVEAAAKLIQHNPKLHFVIAGHKKRSLMTELETQIHKLGIQRNLHFVGFCDDSRAFLSQLDIFTLPSISEGFSIATIEALAAGVPSVVTRCGGPEEIINDQSQALLVPAGDPCALADGIQQCLNNETLRSQLSENGKKRIEQSFSLQTMIEDYYRLYQNFI